MADEKKLYTVQGKVTAVYDPRTVQSANGARKFTSECTDMYLQTGKGGKVKVTFWNQAVDKGLVDADVSITDLKYSGVYKEINQFGSTKASRIHILKGGTTVVAEVEEDPTDPTPTGPSVSEPEQEPEQAPERVQTPQVPEPTPKKRGRPAKVATPEVTAVASPAADTKADTFTQTAPYVPERVTDSHPSEALVLSNLQAAERIARTLGYDRIGMVELITLGDMVGRTAVALRIEAGKDNRMNKYNR